MRKLLLSSVFVTVLFSLEAGNVQAQTCTATPECASLGYTKAKADCPKGALKCPYGNSYFCEKQTCQIGWIYYSDNSCSSDVKSGKTALGVVVYVNPDGIGGQVMSAWPVDKYGNKSNGKDDGTGKVSMYWANELYDIDALLNYNDMSPFNKAYDFDSCDNTDKILADTRTTYFAALATRWYAPTIETKGKWCLPAAGVMTSIYNNQSAVQAGISKLGGVEYPNCCTWSSTEYDYGFMWVSSSGGSDGLTERSKYDRNYVRPVLEF